jgi:hypothetical protein
MIVDPNKVGRMHEILRAQANALNHVCNLFSANTVTHTFNTHTHTLAHTHTHTHI